MSEPVRLQLSRRKGFNLQAASEATNGLPAINVARPSKWGNPFPVDEHMTADEAVRQFRYFVSSQIRNGAGYPLRELKGKNIACWCPLDEPFCHADVLLNFANKLSEQGEGER